MKNQMKTKTFAQGLKSVIHDPRVKNFYANCVKTKEIV